MNKSLISILAFLFNATITFSQIPNLRWINHIQGTEDQQARSATIDKEDNSYSLISFRGEIIHQTNQGIINEQASGPMNTAIAKYKPDGTLIFLKYIKGITTSGISYTIANKIVYDGNDALYIIGTLYGVNNFATSGSSVLIQSPDLLYGVFVAKYDLDGNLIWVKNTPCTSGDGLREISVDQDKNIIITGVFFNNTFDVDFTSKTLLLNRSGAYQSSFVAKYTSDGDLLWANEYKESVINNVITDAQKNIYFIGGMGSSLNFGNGVNLNATGIFEDVVFGKFSSSGKIIWAKNVGGNETIRGPFGISQNDVGMDITFDDNSNLIILGKYKNTINFNPPNKKYEFSASENQSFIAKYTNDGNFIWATSFNSCSGGRSYGDLIAFDPKLKKIIVGGSFYLCTNFGNDAFGNNYTFISKNNWYDAFLATYENDGTLINVSTLSSISDDFLTDISVTKSGILVNGYFEGTADFDFSSCVKDLTSIRRDAFNFKYDYLNISEANILSFYMKEQVSKAIIDTSFNIIEVEVNTNADIQSLKPEITIAECATISPGSNTTLDFTNVQNYTVKDKSGNQKKWMVVVNQEKNISICSGESIVLVGRDPIIETSKIRWETKDLEGNWIDLNINTKNINLTNLINGTSVPISKQFRSLEVTQSLTFKTSIYKVNIFPRVNNLIETPTIYICKNNTEKFELKNVDPISIGNMLWEFSKDSIGWNELSNETNKNLILKEFNKEGYYRRKIITDNCVSFSNIIHIIQFDNVTTAMAGQDIFHCDNPVFQLIANEPNVYEIGTWTLESLELINNVIIKDPHNPILDVELPTGNQAIFKWTITNIKCPELISSHSIKITNSKIPKITLPESITVFYGEKKQLPATIDQVENFKYLWSPTIDIDNPNILNPTISPQDDIIYTLTATNIEGCSTSKTIKIIVFKEIIPVNTFTPNGDGVNDTWFIAGASKLNELIITVFNRNGEVVYQSANYTDPWNGDKNGKPLPVGTYFYIIKDPYDKTKLLKGTVTILR